MGGAAGRGDIGDAGARPTTAPLQRAVVALLANTVATGGLGIVFWVYAARVYPPRDVGPAIAASSLMIALSFTSQLNLSAAMARFLPVAGRASRATVVFSYLVASTTAALVGIVAFVVID